MVRIKFVIEGKTKSHLHFDIFLFITGVSNPVHVVISATVLELYWSKPTTPMVLSPPTDSTVSTVLSILELDPV